MKTTIKVSEGMYAVYLQVKWVNNNLSITGVEGPKSDGDARGGCGQILDTLQEILDENKPTLIQKEDVLKILQYWKEWHLNDMQAGCGHQRAEKWNERPIDPSKPLNAYGIHHPNQKYATHNMLVWVTPEEVPGGLLTVNCPVCGYRYGTKWLRKEVPQEVVDYLFSFPDTPAPGAWDRF